MTKEEAIQRLKYDRAMCYFDPNTGADDQPYDEDCKEMAEALDIAIKILENGSCEQPEQKTGRWIEKSEKYYKLWQESGRSWDDMPYFVTGLQFACSSCFEEFDINENPDAYKWAFCPYCGAKMESEGE